MATPTSKLVVGTKVSLQIENVLSRGKAFIVFFKDETVPVILSKQIAAEDGYVHRTQLTGLTVDVTPTQQSAGQLPGYLGEFDLPMANVSNNALLANRQNTANNYAMAKVYGANIAEEV